MRASGFLATALMAFGEAVALSQQPGPPVEREQKETAKRLEEAVVEHLGKNDEGWDVAVIKSFRLFHKQTNETAENILHAAEKTRVAMQRKWFDNDGEQIRPQCEVFLHPDAQSYTHMTGMSEQSPGHTKVQSDPSGRLIRIQAHLRHGMTEGVLPHEFTHVVFAGKMGKNHVPRWADEGIAVLSEPEERIELHRSKLRELFTMGEEPFGIKELMQMDDYPKPAHIPKFYAQSVSVTEFLTTQKKPSVLTKFLREALDRGDYEGSAKKHYGMSLEEINREWRKHATVKRPAAELLAPPRKR